MNLQTVHKKFWIQEYFLNTKKEEKSYVCKKIIGFVFGTKKEGIFFNLYHFVTQRTVPFR